MTRRQRGIDAGRLTAVLTLGVLIVAIVTLAAIRHWWPFEESKPHVPVAHRGSSQEEHETQQREDQARKEREERERKEHEHQSPKAAYLADLTPTGGDPVTTGDAHIPGRNLPHSVFYDPFAHTESIARVCEATPTTCQATTYELGASYGTLTAVVGVVERYPGYKPVLRWEVKTGSTVLKEGKGPTETAVTISVPLNGASVIELVSNLEELFPDEDTGVIWGNAMVIP